MASDSFTLIAGFGAAIVLAAAALTLAAWMWA